MLIIPAVDLRGGRCVRLVQGDFSRETTYDDDPVSVARQWVDRGTRWLHVVDLDGARAGEPRQLELVARIASCGVPVELGGGLRELAHIAAALDAGVSRVVLGTVAIERPELLDESVRQFGADRLVLGVDARQGRVAVRGWEHVTGVEAGAVIERARQAGVCRVIYTDIERDGTLSSPNFEAIEAVAAFGMAVIASGGVARREHLERLAAIDGVEAAIVGKALYAGELSLEDASDWWVSPAKGMGMGDDHDLAR